MAWKHRNECRNQLWEERGMERNEENLIKVMTEKKSITMKGRRKTQEMLIVKDILSRRNDTGKLIEAAEQVMRTD